MKNFLIWLRWKFFVSIEKPTCNYMAQKALYFEFHGYKKFILKNGAERVNLFGALYVKTIKETHLQTYKQMRRDFMWRFLVKGER